jgi:hypothetical protein
MIFTKRNIPDLRDEMPAAGSTTGALLWRTTVSVAPYFWIAVTLILVLGWFQVELVSLLVYIALLTLAGSFLGLACQSGNVYQAMEYNAALAPSARRRYLIQSVPGFVTIGFLVFLVVAVRYLEAPAGFLQILGVDLDSYILSPTNSDLLKLKMLLLAVTTLISFTTSYSYSALYLNDGISRFFTKTTGIAYVIGYMVAASCITYFVVPESIRTFSIFTFLVLCSVVHYLAGWWLVKTSSKVQHDGLFKGVFRPYWILPFVLLFLFVLSIQMDEKITYKPFPRLFESNGVAVTRHNLEIFDAERLYREQVFSLEEFEKEGNAARLSPDLLPIIKPRIGTGVFSHAPSMRPWSMIFVFMVLGLVTFLQCRMVSEKQTWNWPYRLVFAVLGVSFLGFCIYQGHHKKKNMAECIDDALNTTVYYRSTPFQPTNQDFEGERQSFDYSTLRMHLNVVLVDSISFAPLQTAVFEMEAKPDPEGLMGVFRIKPSSLEALYKKADKLKQIDNFSFITHVESYGSKVGYWWKNSNTNEWEINGSDNLLGDYGLACYGITQPIAVDLDPARQPLGVPFIKTPFFYASSNKDLAVISWMTLWHEGEEGIEQPLSDVLSLHGERMCFNAAQDLGGYRMVEALISTFSVVQHNRLVLVAGCVLLFFAWRGRWRPDGRLPLLVVLSLCIIVWGKGSAASKAMQTLKSKDSSEASRIYSAYHLSRYYLKHPTIFQQLADADFESVNVQNSATNLREWTGLDPESSRLYFAGKWTNFNDPRIVRRYCDWLDASDQRTSVATGNGIFVELDTVYMAKVHNKKYMPSIVPVPEHECRSCQVIKVKRRFHTNMMWYYLPGVVSWTRVEKGYFPHNTTEKEVDFLQNKNLEVRPRDAIQLYFTVKEEYARELDLDPGSEYVLTLSNSEVAYLGAPSSESIIERRPVISEVRNNSIYFEYLKDPSFFVRYNNKELMKAILEASTEVTEEEQEDEDQ